MALLKTRYSCLHNREYVCFACVVRFGISLKCDGFFIQKRYQPVVLTKYNIITLWDYLH